MLKFVRTFQKIKYVPYVPSTITKSFAAQTSRRLSSDDLHVVALSPLGLCIEPTSYIAQNLSISLL